jgi:hypothetical protein
LSLEEYSRFLIVHKSLMLSSFGVKNEGVEHVNRITINGLIACTSIPNKSGIDAWKDVCKKGTSLKIINGYPEIKSTSLY